MLGNDHPACVKRVFPPRETFAFEIPGNDSQPVTENERTREKERERERERERSNYHVSNNAEARSTGLVASERK